MRRFETEQRPTERPPGSRAAMGQAPKAPRGCSPRLVGCVLAALAGVAACGGESSESGKSSSAPRSVSSAPTTSASPQLALPDDVTVFVEFPRYLQLQWRLEVGIDNGSDTDLTITELTLRSPLFEAVAPEPHETVVEGGRRRDLQIPFGAAVCPAPEMPSEVEIAAVIDGVAGRGLVRIDPIPLERISDVECGREAVLQQVDIGYSDEHVVDDGVVQTQLQLRRLEGDDPVTVTAVRGSVLLELQAATESTPLGALAAGEQAASIPVQLRVIRCDPHAVIESKKTFQLAAWVAVGAAEPQQMIVEPEGDLRATLEALIDECLRAQYG